jgi:hypothetical protein
MSPEKLKASDDIMLFEDLPSEIVMNIVDLMDYETLKVFAMLNVTCNNIVVRHLNVLQFQFYAKFPVAPIEKDKLVEMIYYLNSNKNALLNGINLDHSEWTKGRARIYLSSTGETWITEDRYSRINKPASTTWRDNGVKISEKWCVNGKYHRLDGPSTIEWNEHGQKIIEGWCVNGQSYRFAAPASIVWYENGQKRVEIWIEHNKNHRVDGPAETRWYENGQKRSEIWIENGQTHRIDGPAGTWWNIDGTKQGELWFKNGAQLHRIKYPL